MNSTAEKTKFQSPDSRSAFPAAFKMLGSTLGVLGTPPVLVFVSGVVVLLIAGALLRSYYLVSIEDFQTAIFPAILALFVVLGRSGRRGMPAGFVLFAFCCWFAGMLNIRGGFPGWAYSSPAYVARLDEDPAGAQARRIFNGINQVGRHFRIAGVSLLQRSFPASRQAEEWLNKLSHSALVLVGNANWLEVVSSRRLGFGDEAARRLAAKIAGSSSLPAPQNTDHRTLLVPLAGIPERFEVALLPEVFALPAEPLDLSRHFVAWFVQGVAAPAEVGDDMETALSRRDLAVREALELWGEWKSSAPRAAAHHFVGTLSLLEALPESIKDAGAVACASDDLGQAMIKAQERYHPELRAAVLNNIGIYRVVTARNGRDLTRARELFSDAMMILDENEQVPSGARAAYHNLLVMERNGL